MPEHEVSQGHANAGRRAHRQIRSPVGTRGGVIDLLRAGSGTVRLRCAAESGASDELAGSGRSTHRPARTGAPAVAASIVGVGAAAFAAKRRNGGGGTAGGLGPNAPS